MRRTFVGCCARAASGHARRAAEKRDELAPSHSITSSARTSSVGGTSSPSALAVLRLMTNSNLVGRMHRQVGGLLALEDAIDVDANLSVRGPRDRFRSTSVRRPLTSSRTGWVAGRRSPVRPT